MSDEMNRNENGEINFTLVENAPSRDEKSKERKQRRNRRKGRVRRGIALVSAAVLFGVVAGSSFYGITKVMDKNTRQSTVSMQEVNETDNTAILNQTTAQSTSTAKKEASTGDLSTVVENVKPAIVSINSTSTMTEYDFFGRKYENEVTGSGSGIIIGQSDDELLIVTNNHVVEDATAVEIVFGDDSKVLAKIKGTEPSADLAVVSVKMKDINKDTKGYIKIATLGDSNKVKLGQMAIAIGNALGFGQSVTVGYISALNREVSSNMNKLKLIQTDAAINPGNSGGALLNAKGEIIGINSIKYSSTEIEGIGYAIPISDAIPIINELINREDLEEDEQGYLGITGKNVEKNYSEAFGMPIGIYVSEVHKNTAAEKAGIHKGDIIVGLNGKKIENMADLQNTLMYTRGGTEVTITINVLDNGSYIEKDVKVTLGFRK